MHLPDTPLFVKTHDFLLWLIRHTQRFPKNLHAHKTQVCPGSGGLKFLGFKLWPQTRRLQQSSIRRLSARARRQRWLRRRGLIRAESIGHSLRAWIAHTQWANASGIRRALVGRLRF